MGSILRNVISEDNGGHGVFSGPGSNIDVDGLVVRRNGGDGVHIEGIVEHLGFPPGTDPEFVVEALRVLQANFAEPPETKSALLRATRLVKSLAKGTFDTAKLIAQWVTISNDPAQQETLHRILEKFGR